MSECHSEVHCLLEELNEMVILICIMEGNGSGIPKYVKNQCSPDPPNQEVAPQLPKATGRAPSKVDVLFRVSILDGMMAVWTDRCMDGWEDGRMALSFMSLSSIFQS